MRYKNTKTGFEFETESVIEGKDWVKLSPSSVETNTEEEKKPVKKRTKKDE